MASNWSPGGNNSFAEGPYGKILHAAWTDSAGNYISDQLIRAERGGAVSLLIDEHGRYGLIAAWRPVARSRDEYMAAWPNVDFSCLGRVSIEAVRGFSESEDNSGQDTAFREAEEEVGLQHGAIKQSINLMPIVDNTSISSHFTGVMAFEVDSMGFDRVVPHISENIINGIIWYTADEVDQLIESEEIFCALTLSAIFLYRLHARKDLASRVKEVVKKIS